MVFRSIPFVFVGALIGFLAFAEVGVAQTTVSLTPVRDNTLFEDPAGSVSNGAGGNGFVGRTNQGANFLRRMLVAFDVAATVPAGSTITAAQLQLQLDLFPPGQGPTTITLHRVSSDWGEGASFPVGAGGQGGPAAAGDATWTDRFFGAGMPWASAGGDFTAAASASLSVPAMLGPNVWIDAGMVADVQFWLDNPSSDFGWLVLGDEAVAQSARRFQTREGLVPPVLQITYTAPAPPPTVVPTAGTVGLAAFAGLLLLFALRRLRLS